MDAALRRERCKRTKTNGVILEKQQEIIKRLALIVATILLLIPFLHPFWPQLTPIVEFFEDPTVVYLTLIALVVIFVYMLVTVLSIPTIIIGITIALMLAGVDPSIPPMIAVGAFVALLYLIGAGIIPMPTFAEPVKRHAYSLFFAIIFTGFLLIFYSALFSTGVLRGGHIILFFYASSIYCEFFVDILFKVGILYSEKKKEK